MWFGSKASTPKPSNVAAQEDFQEIYDSWADSCTQSGIEIPKGAIAELKKRMKKAGSAESKAKLDFSGCKLTDEHVIALIESLAAAPAIAKLDLSKNPLTDESANSIIQLLVGQISLSREVDLDERIDASFLGEVNLTSTNVSAEMQDRVTLLATCLHTINTISLIRKAYLNIGAPDILVASSITAVWNEVMGRKPDKYHLASIFAEAGKQNELSFEELANALLLEFVKTGEVKVITEEKMNEINSIVGTDEDGNPWVDPDASQEVVVVNENKPPRENLETKKGSPVDASNSSKSQGTLTTPSLNKTSSKLSHEREEEEEAGDDDEEGYVNEEEEARLAEEAQFSAKPPQRRKSFLNNLLATVNNTPTAAATGKSTTVTTPTAAKKEKSVHFEQTVSTAEPVVPPVPVEEPVEVDRKSTRRVSNRSLSAGASDSDSSSAPTNIAESEKSGSDQNQPTGARGSLRKLSSSRLTESSPSKSLFAPADAVEPAISIPEETFQNVMSSQIKQQPPMVSVYEEPFDEVKEDLAAVGDDSNIHDNYAEDPATASEFVEDRYQAKDGAASGLSIDVDGAVKASFINLSGYELSTVSLDDIFPSSALRSIRTLCLRNNSIPDLEGLHLRSYMPCLLDLDVAFNSLSGKLPDKVFPPSLERLDLSNNNISDISNLLSCINLKAVYVVNNVIKTLHGFPPNLEIVDLSDNLISSTASLRAISFFNTKIESLGIAGNPVVDSVADWRVKLVSTLPKLKILDGIELPRPKPRKDKNAAEKLDKSLLTKKQQEESDRKRIDEASVLRKQLEKSRDAELQKLSSLRPSKKISRDEGKAIGARLMLRTSEITAAVHKHSQGLRKQNEERSPGKGNRKGSTEPKTTELAKLVQSALAAPLVKPLEPSRTIHQSVSNVVTSNPESAFPSLQELSAAYAKDSTLEVPEVCYCDNWLSRCTREFGLAGEMMKKLFLLSRKSSLDHQGVKDLQQSISQITFFQESKHSFDLQKSVEYLSSIGDSDRLQWVQSARESCEAIASVLTDVESSLKWCDTLALGVGELRNSIHATMTSPHGKLVNKKVLSCFGCPYVAKSDSDGSSPTAAERLASPRLPSASNEAKGLTSPKASLMSLEEMNKHMDNVKSRLFSKAFAGMSKFVLPAALAEPEPLLSPITTSVHSDAALEEVKPSASHLRQFSDTPAAVAQPGRMENPSQTLRPTPVSILPSNTESQVNRDLSNKEPDSVGSNAATSFRDSIKARMAKKQERQNQSSPDNSVVSAVVSGGDSVVGYDNTTRNQEPIDVANVLSALEGDDEYDNDNGDNVEANHLLNEAGGELEYQEDQYDEKRYEDPNDHYYQEGGYAEAAGHYDENDAGNGNGDYYEGYNYEQSDQQGYYDEHGNYVEGGYQYDENNPEGFDYNAEGEGYPEQAYQGADDYGSAYDQQYDHEYAETQAESHAAPTEEFYTNVASTSLEPTRETTPSVVESDSGGDKPMSAKDRLRARLNKAKT